MFLNDPDNDPAETTDTSFLMSALTTLPNTASNKFGRIVGRSALQLVDRCRGTEALKIYQKYLQSEWLPAQDVRSRQWIALKELLNHAYTNVPYYRLIMNNIRLSPSDIRTWADFGRLPVLTKEEVRKHKASLIAKNAASFQPHRKSTSGSTGEPLSFLLDHNSRSAHWACMYRQWHTGGWRPGEALVFLGGSSIVPSVRAFQRVIYYKLNRWLLLSAFEMSDATMYRWVKKLQTSGVQFMHAYASSAYLFAQFLEKHGLTSVKFRSVFTSAEPLYPAQREVIQRVFSCEVFDLYGANDGGGFAYECPHHMGLHCVSERAVIEVMREDGSAAQPGQSGQIVSTDLLNYSMPFIRYAVGDTATAGIRECPCGRGLPLIESIQGRSVDFITLPSNEKVHGEFFSHLFRHQEWITQFQVTQEDKTHLRVTVKSQTGDALSGIKAIELILRQKFIGMSVRVHLAQEIPAAANGKFRYVVNKSN